MKNIIFFTICASIFASCCSQEQVEENSIKKHDAIKGDAIQIKASNGKFVCADANKHDSLFADRDAAQAWETFGLIKKDSTYSYIIAHNNKYVCYDTDLKETCIANCQEVNEWGTFKIIKIDSNLIAIQTSTKKFLSVDPKNNSIVANKDKIGKTEMFELIKE